MRNDVVEKWLAKPRIDGKDLEPLHPLIRTMILNATRREGWLPDGNRDAIINPAHVAENREASGEQ